MLYNKGSEKNNCTGSYQINSHKKKNGIMNQLMFQNFVTADSASYLCKSLFYDFKRDILIKEAVEDGWQQQIIKDVCRACIGSGKRTIKKLGKRTHTVTCKLCNGSGLFKNETRYHKRYVLHGLVFLLSVKHRPDEEPKQIIKGHYKHECIEPRKVYRSLLILFAYYNQFLLEQLLTYSFPAQEIWKHEKETILKLIEEQKAA